MIALFPATIRQRHQYIEGVVQASADGAQLANPNSVYFKQRDSRETVKILTA